MNKLDIYYIKNNRYYNYKTKRLLTNKKIIEKIKGLYIPKIWKEIYIIPDSKKIKAIGRDKNDKVQYIYAKKYRKNQENKKYCNLAKFIKKLPKIRRDINYNINKNDDSKKYAIASIFSIMDYCCPLRVGNEIYKEKNATYGLTTLGKKHVLLKGGKININFKGKKGVLNNCECYNKKLAHLIKKYKNNNKNNTDYIFTYKNEDNKYLPIKSIDMNLYLKKYGNFTTKDFRTIKANTLLLKILKNNKIPKNDKTKKILLNNAIKMVSEILNNTKNICKNNYISDKIIKNYNNNTNNFYKILKNKSIDESLIYFFKNNCNS